MPRFLLSVTLALLAFAPAGQAQGPGNFPNMPPGGATSAGTCDGCNREFTWSGGTANAPKRCPHCNTRFGYVENEDGTRTNLGGGYGGSSRGVVRLVIFGIVVLCVVLGGLAKLLGVLVSGGSARPKRKTLKKRRPVVEEDDDEDDAPPRESDRPRANAKPTPDDDAGFEVLGDAPPPPAPGPPPRRARAKLLPPDGAP